MKKNERKKERRKCYDFASNVSSYMCVHIRSRMPRFFRPDPSLHALNFYDATSRVHADTGMSGPLGPDECFFRDQAIPSSSRRIHLHGANRDSFGKKNFANSKLLSNGFCNGEVLLLFGRAFDVIV